MAVGHRAQKLPASTQGIDSPDGKMQNGSSRSTLCGWRMELVKFKDLPPFLRDNEYLLTRHRPALYSFKECAKSIFRIHTETCNIWTHIIGSAIFVAIMLYHWTLPPNISPLSQKISFSAFYLGAIICMGMSSVYHTVTCHSEEIGCLFSKLDYCGVIGLIMTSCVPWFHYGFYCHDTLKTFYTILMLTFGTISICIVLHPIFGVPKYRPLRAGLFIVLGLTGIFPAIHFLVLEGFFDSLDFMMWLVAMAVVYIAGGVIYAVRIPERFRPGTFDIVGQSHQILHICVVSAAIFCLIGVMNLATFRMSAVPICGV